MADRTTLAWVREFAYDLTFSLRWLLWVLVGIACMIAAFKLGRLVVLGRLQGVADGLLAQVVGREPPKLDCRAESGVAPWEPARGGGPQPCGDDSENRDEREPWSRETEDPELTKHPVGRGRGP